ncbi:MAG: phosphotransferase family protein [Acidobacteriota bacterium]
MRAGEELDLGRLATWLASILGTHAGDVRVAQFPGGHSNLTYLVSAGATELVLRRPPFGSTVKTAHDMAREHRILSALAPVFQRAPRPVAFCDDPTILGCDFYVMEPMRGTILRREADLGEATARRLSESFVDVLADLHGVDVAAAGLSDFGRPGGYVMRQVTGWTQRYAASQTDSIPDVEAVAAWLAANMPAESGAAVIHNDYKLDNLVLDPRDPARIVGVLDWEMATIGDPLMDLGTALCYWVEARDPLELLATRFGPTHLPGMATRAELAARYFAASGATPRDVTFYRVFGLFKTAVVAQQIYARFRKGMTGDPRFAGFIDAVRILAREASRAISGAADRPAA